MRKIAITIVLMIFLFPASVLADELKLIKGNGVPVCEAHLKNLKSMDFQDMACHREKYPANREIKRPTWEQLDFRENKELLRKISNFFIYGDQFTKDEGFGSAILSERLWEPQTVLDQKFPAQYALYMTKVDIDNDGKAERILLFREQICMLSGAYSRPLLVVDEDKDLIDVKKTEPLLQNISKSGYDIKTKTIEHLYRLYDVFFYKNATYFDKWFIYDWTLAVYKQSKDKVKEVCKYKYIFDKEERHEN